MELNSLNDLNYTLTEDELNLYTRINIAIKIAEHSLNVVDLSLFNENELYQYYNSTYGILIEANVQLNLFYKKLINKLNLTNIKLKNLQIIDSKLYSR